MPYGRRNGDPQGYGRGEALQTGELRGQFELHGDRIRCRACIDHVAIETAKILSKACDAGVKLRVKPICRQLPTCVALFG